MKLVLFYTILKSVIKLLWASQTVDQGRQLGRGFGLSLWSPIAVRTLERQLNIEDLKILRLVEKFISF